MSDPVTNVEIEDVLSSIRRLVADDMRDTKPKAAPVPDRLLLDPSLRVSDDPVVGAEAVDDTAPDDDMSGPVVLDTPAPLVDEAAPLAGADQPLILHPVREAERQDTVASDLGSQVKEETVKILNQLVDEDVAKAVSGPHAADPLDEIGDQDSAVSEDDAFAPQDAEVLPAEDPEGLEDSAPFEGVLSALSAVEDHLQTEPVAEGEDHTDRSPDNDPAQAPDEAAAVASESLESKIAALEKLVGHKTDEWEGDDPQDEVEDEPTNAVFHRSSDVLDWQDHTPEPPADLAESAQPEVAVDEHVAAPDLPDVSLEERAEVETPAAASTDATAARETDQMALLDDAMLRDMVADIIRQELQGALGERITRNVRKLVRREIHRVLMSQEFD